MATSVNKKQSFCPNGNCSIKTNHQNGKGDKVRPFLKKQYDKNYESINWTRKKS
jgi:hypothetical protein